MAAETPCLGGTYTNWVLNQFVVITQRSIIVCFLSLFAEAGLNLPPFEMTCSKSPSQLFSPVVKTGTRTFPVIGQFLEFWRKGVLKSHLSDNPAFRQCP
jgi:hypothetical protein